MDNNAVKAHFNTIASSYDKYKTRNKTYYFVLKQTVKSLLTGKNHTVLDIGCGTGDILHFLNPSFGVGIDISSQMIKLAKNKYRSCNHLIFKVHDIEKKLVKGKFSFILLLDVIEHLKDKNRALSHISQMMDKDTVLIISMANPFWEPLLLILEKLRLKMPEGPHFRIRENEFISILKKHNLHIIKKVVSFPKTDIPLLMKIALIYAYKIKKY